jgi:drug/metabolite transporter (DMT)-like permease
MNQVLAPYILGERLTRIDTAATGIIVLGIVLSTAFGVHSSASFTIEKLLSLWSINLRTHLCICTQHAPLRFG